MFQQSIIRELKQESEIPYTKEYNGELFTFEKALNWENIMRNVSRRKDKRFTQEEKAAIGSFRTCAVGFHVADIVGTPLGTSTSRVFSSEGKREITYEVDKLGNEIVDYVRDDRVELAQSTYKRIKKLITENFSKIKIQ